MNNTTTLLGMTSGQLVYFYSENERYSTLLKAISTRFTSASDLAHAYIERDGEKYMLIYYLY